MFFEDKLISIISPVYFGEKVIAELIKKIHRSLDELNLHYEIILADDGSTDASWETIAGIVEQDHTLTGIKLDKNYGQHAAILAGIENAKGDFIIVMDCDLQDPPEEIHKLINAAGENTDIVFALRDKSWQPFLKRFYSILFYFFLSLLTGHRFRSRTSNFGLYRKAIIQQALKSDRGYFVLPVAVRKFSKKIKYVEVGFNRDSLRPSSYNFIKAFKLAIKILAAQINLFGFRKTNRQKYVISELKKHPAA